MMAGGMGNGNMMGQNYGQMGGVPGQQFNDGGFNNRQNIA